MIRRFTVCAAVVLMAAVGSAACGRNPKPQPPAPAATAPPPPTTPAPPPPPPPAPAPAPAPAPTEDEIFRNKTLEELNAEKPLGDASFASTRPISATRRERVLQKNADWMKRWPTTKVMVEGHADSRGTNEYNLALGERRADAVRDYLVSLGLADRPDHHRQQRGGTPFCYRRNRSVLAAEPPRPLHHHGEIATSS